MAALDGGSVAQIQGSPILLRSWHTGDVPDVCTCGAKLPPDARFCHKCGKPQREEMIIEEPEVAPVEAAVAPNVPPPLPAAPQIGFHNRLAVRAALLAGFFALAGVMVSSQVAQPLALLSLLAGGFFAVYLYERRSGQRLSVVSGARLGWLCGIFLFVLVAVILAVMAVMLSDPAMLSSLRDQLKAQGASAAAVQQMVEMFQSPSGVGAALVSSFVMLTVFTACGGALGAKVLGAPSFRD